MAKTIYIKTAGGTVRAKLQFNPAFQKEFILRYGKGGKVQSVLDETVVRESEPYYPMDEGFLYESTVSQTVIGSGRITSNTPYARYQYYGVSKNGNSNFLYKNNESGKRGKLWFARYKSDNLSSLVYRIKAYAKSLGGF